jgi:DNA-binding response OmpR family regulator
MKRVLLCDDECHILHAAEIKLRRSQIDVRTASDGEEAWEIIQDWLPDVLVTDCQMPRLDGLGLIRRCRDHEPTRDLPILMLTAKGFELSHAELQQQFGILGIMLKPFSPRELLRCIEQIVETGKYTAPKVYV